MTWKKTINITHGESSPKWRTSEYRAWAAAKNRCFNKKNAAYARYGGRGIGMWLEWADSYEVFLRDMGRRPTKKHSLDRVNNDGHYSPSNCRWATASEQAFNRRPKCHM